MRTPIAIVAVLVVASTAAHPATIDVFPGAGTPLQDAISAANPGDTVRVHAGTYVEGVTIDKRLKLRSARDGVVTIDAGCGEAAIEVFAGAERVTIQGVTLTGSASYDLNINGATVNRITVKDVILIEACGTAFYGINIYQATRVKLIRNDASGYLDAGIYIGDIPVDGRVKAVKNNCHDNVRGILLEDSPDGSKLVVRGNTAANNSDGIFSNNADAAVISRNTVTGNTNNGIWLNAASENNRVRGNTISGSGSVDGVDDGTGNCWRRNTCAGTCPDVCP